MMTRLRRTRGDEGATLIIVLVLVTFISVVLGIILSQADTSARATIAVGKQAATQYAADGAAQAAVNQLRADNFNGAAGGCNATSTEVLSNFYPSNDGTAAASAAVKCTPDPSNTGSGSGGGANSSPGTAMLTLSTDAGGERGIYVSSSNSGSVKVKGGIFSNSTIYLETNKSNLENTNTTNSYVYAMGACTTSGAQIISTPAAVCNYSTNPVSAADRRGKDPGTIAGHGLSFDAPAAPTAAGSSLPAACSSKTVFEFQPGLYSSATALNALTDSAGSCSGSVWHFNPGKYYFSFQDAAVQHKWRVSSGFLVGGTSTATAPLTVPKVLAQNNAKQPFCVAPTTGGTNLNSGVEFVFGGDSRMDVTKNGTANPNVQICASNSASGPPIAIYGLKSAIGGGAFTVPAESGCITQSGYVNPGGDGNHCAILQTYQDPSPSLTIYGTTYVPKAVIDLNLNNNTVQVFRWGLITRSLLIGATGSSDLTAAVIEVPDDAPAPFALPSVMYLDVYVCAASSTCTTAGPVRLRAKVELSATTPTTVTVLSWSAQN